MEVYFKAPEYNPEKPEELIFPNSEDVPSCGWSSMDEYDLRAATIQDLDRYQLLRRDLLKLAGEARDYLANLDVTGKAIVYYRSQEVFLKGNARKIEQDPYNRYRLYTFGVQTATPEGESGFYLAIQKGWRVMIGLECSGIANKVLSDIVFRFPWRSKVVPKMLGEEWLTSNFSKIVKKHFEPDWGWGRTERAFNIPYEEYVSRGLHS